MTGSELRELRKGARLTIKELAEKVGVSTASIGFWETERNPIPEKRISALRNILAIGGVQSKPSPSDLQSKTAKPETKPEIGNPSKVDPFSAPVEKSPPKWTGQLDISSNSPYTSGWDPGVPGSDKTVEVRICHAVELGPRTLAAINDMIKCAVSALEISVHPEKRREIEQSSEEGNRYRNKTKDILGRGW